MNINTNVPQINLNPGSTLSFDDKYDISVGLSEENINDIMLRIHRGLNSQFTCDEIELKDIKIAVGWDMKKAPKIHLEKSQEALNSFRAKYGTPDEIAGSLAKSLLETYAVYNKGGEREPTREDINHASDKIMVKICLEDFLINLRNTATGASGSAEFKICAYCTVELNKMYEVCIQPFAAEIIMNKKPFEYFGKGLIDTDAEGIVNLPGQGGIKFDYDDFLMFLINKILLPIIIKEVAPLIPKFKLPNFEFMGYTLCELKVYLDKSYIIASTNIIKVSLPPGASEDDRIAPNPTGGFFISLSKNFLRMALGLAMKEYGKIKDSGSVAIIDYNYELDLSSADIELDNKKKEIVLQVSANVKASVIVDLWLTSISFSAHGTTIGKPGVAGELFTKDNQQISFKINSLNEFLLTILVSSMIDMYYVDLACNLLANAIVQGVLLYYRGKEIDIIKVPTLSFSIPGAKLGVTVEGFNFTVTENGLFADGSLKVNAAREFPQKNLIASKDEYLEPGEGISCNSGRYYLVYQKDGDLVFYRNLTYERLWSSNTAVDPFGRIRPFKARMQSDGNFVIYNRNLDTGEVFPVFASGTNGKGWVLNIQDDGHVVIFDENTVHRVWERPEKRGSDT